MRLLLPKYYGLMLSILSDEEMQLQEPLEMDEDMDDNHEDPVDALLDKAMEERLVGRQNNEGVALAVASLRRSTRPRTRSRANWTDQFSWGE